MIFSIIIPVYNVEKYLSQCLDSILNQDFTDFELILVDDGSTDRSGEICDQYKSKDSRVNVIHQENSGQATARNAGTKASKGEYIIYIDSDDFIISNDFLSELYSSINNNKVDILFYKHKKFFDKSGEYSDCSYSYGNVLAENDYSKAVKKLVEDDAFFGMPWNKAIKRDLIISHNISFPNGLKGEDMDWIFNLIIEAKTVGFIDKSYIAYRQRDNSTTSSLKIKNIQDFLFIVEKWSVNLRSMSGNEILKEALLGALAKYYCNLLIAFTRVHDDQKNEYKNRIKQLSWLLRYGKSRRPKLIGLLNRSAGFNMTVLFIDLIGKVK